MTPTVKKLRRVKRRRLTPLGRIRMVPIALIVFFSLLFLFKGLDGISKDVQNLGIASIIVEDEAHIAIHYPLTANQTVNKQIKSYIDSQLDDFMEDIDESERLSEFYINFEVFHFDETTLSFVFNHYLIHPTHANGHSYFHTLTFDLKTGETFELKDIFATDQYLDFLSEQIYHQLESFYTDKDEVDLDHLRTGTLPELENFKHFAIDRKGLTIFFDNYQFGSKINEVNHCIIGWEQLSEVVSERFEYNGYLPTEKPPVAELPSEETEPPVVDSDLADKKLIALTFDDGPHQTLTPKLLDILAEHEVPATFFVIGSLVEYYPELVSRAFQEGHQIGNHTYNHKNLSNLSVEEIRKEISETADLIESATGSKPNILRPPYGSYNDEVLTHADAAVIMWSLDTEDWKHRDSDLVYDAVVNQAQDGDIVLFHDIHETTIATIEAIILQLKDEGYTFVTIQQLIEARDKLNLGQVYYNLPQ